MSRIAGSGTLTQRVVWALTGTVAVSINRWSAAAEPGASVSMRRAASMPSCCSTDTPPKLGGGKVQTFHDRKGPQIGVRSAGR